MVKKGEESADAPTESRSPASGAAAPRSGRPLPIVITKKRKKKRYTRGLRDVTYLHDGLVMGAVHLSDGLAVGLSDYRKRSRQSARKKRDGTVRDILDNSTSAFAEAARKWADAPQAVAKPVSKTRAWRRARSAVASVAVLPISILLR